MAAYEVLREKLIHEPRDDLMRPAPYIVVVGPDGCGKTTIANRTAERLAKNTRTLRRDFRFEILPPISRVLRREHRKSKPAEGTHLIGMVTPLTPLKAAIVGIWYGIDHLLGHLLVQASRRKQSALVFARSYHDFMYQRAYERIPTFIPRTFIALGPKPDLIVCPYRDPATIFAGKPELTEDEIRRQYLDISRRLGAHQNFHFVDANCGVDTTVEEVIRIVGSALGPSV